MKYTEEFKIAVVAAIKAMIGQGRQSIIPRNPDNGESSHCAYRGPCGDKCIIGHIITDINYSPSLEGDGIDQDNIAVQNAVTSSIEGMDVLLASELSVLGSLQSMHDNNEGPDFSEEFKEQLELYVADGELPMWTLEGLS